MNFRMSAPSKTFLTGEYAVLVGGPGLVLNTPPRFQFQARKMDQEAPNIAGIPEGSPAHVWLYQREPLLRGWNIRFEDPHEGRGGFGASGAQFLIVHAFTTALQMSDRSPRFNIQDIFNDYRVCARGSGSGADILAQFSGQVSLVNVETRETEAKDWPYPDLGFAILRTGTKIATHVHLQTLDREKVKDLRAPALAAADAFGRDDARIFAAKVQAYQEALEASSLQAPRTTELLQKFKRQPWCLAAKGCGAWGADTILLLFEKINAAEAADFARTLGTPVIADSLSGGLEILSETD